MFTTLFSCDFSTFCKYGRGFVLLNGWWTAPSLFVRRTNGRIGDGGRNAQLFYRITEQSIFGGLFLLKVHVMIWIFQLLISHTRKVLISSFNTHLRHLLYLSELFINQIYSGPVLVLIMPDNFSVFYFFLFN